MTSAQWRAVWNCAAEQRASAGDHAGPLRAKLGIYKRPPLLVSMWAEQSLQKQEAGAQNTLVTKRLLKLS